MNTDTYQAQLLDDLQNKFHDFLFSLTPEQANYIFEACFLMEDIIWEFHEQALLDIQKENMDHSVFQTNKQNYKQHFTEDPPF